VLSRPDPGVDNMIMVVVQMYCETYGILAEVTGTISVELT